jgi:hypothetical protein
MITQVAKRPQADSRRSSPWVTNQVLLNLSVWWVQATRPQTSDFGRDVARTFDSLQRQLQ